MKLFQKVSMIRPSVNNIQISLLVLRECVDSVNKTVHQQII